MEEKLPVGVRSEVGPLSPFCLIRMRVALGGIRAGGMVGAGTAATAAA